jgi:hypothetical protein
LEAEIDAFIVRLYGLPDATVRKAGRKPKNIN